jgi:hypothetical protein
MDCELMMKPLGLSIVVALVLILSVPRLHSATQASASQSEPAPAPKPAAPKGERTSRVTLEVTGGENSAPVENASVYFKYVEEHRIIKDKKLELNVKTNREGVAHVPAAPLGRVLIQIVADGWKTYGRWYDITDEKQTIQIHLERPPRWY